MAPCLLGALLAGVCPAIAGCPADEQAQPGRRDASVATAEGPLGQARHLARADVEVARALEPSDDGLAPDADGYSSPGWRVPNLLGRAPLGAVLPTAADGPLVVGLGRHAHLRLRLVAEGARPAGATLDDGRLHYQDAYPFTDLLAAASPARVELLLLLREPRAPSTFSWRVTLPPGLPGSRWEPSGALLFVDARGDAAIRVLRPFAIDAAGQRRDADLRWEDGRLTVHLDTRGLAYPVLLDPILDAAVWQDKSPGGTPPTARQTHGLAYDSVRQHVVLFGGDIATTPQNETWAWDGTAWSCKCGAAPCPSTCTIPARRNLAMAFDVNAGQAVVFGGYLAGSVKTDDTWVWNGTTWTKKCGASAPAMAACGPMARTNPGLAYVGSGVTVLFGGNGTDSSLNDTWEWNGTSWTQKFANDCPQPGCPPGRNAHAMAGDPDRGVAVVFGGWYQVAAPSDLADTWEYSRAAGTWTCKCGPTCATPSVCGPNRRMQAGMAYDSARRRVVLFGGFDETTALDANDTWDWDGTQWRQFVTTACGAAGQPGCRRTNLAHDGSRHRTVLFSGVGAAADTWELRFHGGSCTAPGDCDTGFCKDGVCCEEACTGSCKQCDASPGTCTSVVNGPDPDTCASPTYTCGPTGVCGFPNGVTCPGGAGQCASTKCIDGLCCDADCAGTCMACNVAGSPGTCTNVPRNQQDPGTCTGTNACNGGGVCKYGYGVSCGTDGTLCASGYCVDTVCCDTDCTGTCKACNVTNHVGTCYNLDRFAHDTNATITCVSPRACDGSGNCFNENGGSCSPGCASGNCVDSVCCDTACTGVCMSCAVASHVGACWPIDKYGHDTNPPNTCVDGAQKKGCDGVGGPSSCKLDNGESCGTNGTLCASGNCVEGVCCDDPCTTLCKSCVVATHAGTCWNIPAYGHDSVGSGTCVDGAVKYGCDGTSGPGSCRKDNGESCGVDGTQCISGKCVDGVCCDADCNGTCVACNVAGNVGTCTNVPRNQQDPGTCTGTSACDGVGVCKLGYGVACGTNNGLCASGFCADGVCCDTDCTGTCKACNVASHVGTCWNLDRFAHDPNATTTCLSPKACDGAGNCFNENGGSCSPGCASGNCVEGVCCDDPCASTCKSCQVGGHVGTCWSIDRYGHDTIHAATCVSPSACDGAGHCYRENGQGCSPGCASGYCVDGVCCGTDCLAVCKACNVTGSEGSCTNLPRDAEDTYGSTQCIKAENHACDGNGVCKAKNGVACGTDGALCASGNCVDGVCCNTACSAVCMACNVSGSEGSCTNIPINGKDTWPAGICVAPKGCDGFGVCRKENGQPCPNGASDCASNICVEGVCCDDVCTGVCKSCLVASAVGTCTNLPRFAHDTYPTDTCIAPSSCDGNGACKSENGQDCGSNPALCASGNCVDGKCCDTACTTPCWACNLSPAGTCSLLPQNSADSFPGNACVAPNACDGNGNCKLKQGETCSAAGQCATGFCIDNVCCAEACDAPCKVCGSGGLCTNIGVNLEDNVATLPCLKPNGSCDGFGHCKRVRGQPCQTGDDCVDGICADGVCCDGACGGKCESCNQLGFVGTCRKYPAGSDPDAECGSGPCKGQCDGTLGCAYPDATTVCVAQSCTSGSRHLAAKCDGAGGCTPGASNDCAPYECDDAQLDCQAGCVDDGDCQHAFWCDGTHCVDDLPVQDSCTRDGQCQSGHCVDGVCCNEACTSDCQYCAYPGTRGTCTAVTVGDDPRRKCQAASGGSDSCAGACDATGQCAFPDVGTVCGLCSACDGNGRCTTLPEDDARCGVIDCSGLDTACRSYADLSAGRCATLGVCKSANDPATCTRYTDLQCSDGGPAQADGGGPPQVDSGTTPPGQSSGCSLGGSAPGPLAPLLLAPLAWAWVRRRRR